MKISSNDSVLIRNVIKLAKKISKQEANAISNAKNNFDDTHRRIAGLNFEHPVDDECLLALEDLLSKSSNNLYKNIDDLKSIWSTLMGKSIKCLRFFDTREPYLKHPEANPQAYGLDELKDYYNEFAEFEALLYGSNQFYRDHVVHLFRTWLIGLNILLDSPSGGNFYTEMHFEGVVSGFQINFFESVSMWTIAALCHDLGYPLEKSKNIIDRTEKMMKYLVSQPTISHDVQFSGTQETQNNFILRLLSSKMYERSGDDDYAVRLQSKYFMKYAKSLESYKHGIISSIIIYKALLYFLESDFSLHDDYRFDHKGAHHFYVKRDILRSISSHTCKDIYHMKSTTFPLLLIVADELQEWGRNRWSDFYKSQNHIDTGFNLIEYSSKRIAVEYIFEKASVESATELIRFIYRQFIKFRLLFRDGQDTESREFDAFFRYAIKTNKGKMITATSLIPARKSAVFKVETEAYGKQTLGKIVKQLKRERFAKIDYDGEKTVFIK